MLLWRYRVPKIARHAALGHMNDYDLENQSRGRDRSSRRRSTAVLTGAGISEPSLLNARCNVGSVATTILPSSCLADLMRSAHCRSMRRWTLNGYTALIGSTSLTRCMHDSNPRAHQYANVKFVPLLRRNYRTERWDSASLKHCPENTIPKRRGDAVVSIRK
jgi:hypothetical protein